MNEPASEPTVHFSAEPGADLTIPFARLPELAGSEFAGRWWSVDPDRVRAFEDGTYLDELPFEWPDGAFPESMLEGFHLLGLLDYMMNPVLRVRGGEFSGWNYGLDRVRFVSPVSVEDRIRLTGRIAEVRPKDEGFLILQDCAVEVDGREQPGFVAQWWVFWLPAGPASKSDLGINKREG